MPKRRVFRHEVVQPLDKPYRFIPLTQGQNAIVDVSDFASLSEFNWHADWSEKAKTFYARRNVYVGGKNNPMRMHQCITGAKETDHINGNGLDNRKENLRACTRTQNNCNRKAQSKNTSGYKGVYRTANRKRWRVWIGVNGASKYIGTFDTPEQAAKAYDDAAKEMHGDFAKFNMCH